MQTGVGTGRYGFACDLEPSLEHGFEFTVTATARASDGVSTELKRPGSKMPANPDRRLAERVFEEVMRLGQRSGEPESQSRTTPDELREVVQNIEIAQARIEATLAAIEPMASPSQLGLKLILGVSLAVAVISLALGIYSMWLQ